MAQLVLEQLDAALNAVREDLAPRAEELAQKNTDGVLTPEEHREYAAIVRLNDALSLLRLQAEEGNHALDVARFSCDEQFKLLGHLWETLGRDPKALPLSGAQKAELDRRLDELGAEGPVGLTWDEVVAQARAR